MRAIRPHQVTLSRDLRAKEGICFSGTDAESWRALLVTFCHTRSAFFSCCCRHRRDYSGRHQMASLLCAKQRKIIFFFLLCSLQITFS